MSWEDTAIGNWLDDGQLTTAQKQIHIYVAWKGLGAPSEAAAHYYAIVNHPRIALTEPQRIRLYDLSQKELADRNLPRLEEPATDYKRTLSEAQPTPPVAVPPPPVAVPPVAVHHRRGWPFEKAAETRASAPPPGGRAPVAVHPDKCQVQKAAELDEHLPTARPDLDCAVDGLPTARPDLDCAVDGLAAVLINAKLDEETMKKVADWCKVQKAAELDEVKEFFEDMITACGVPDLPKKRFLKFLEKALKALEDVTDLNEHLPTARPDLDCAVDGLAAVLINAKLDDETMKKVADWCKVNMAVELDEVKVCFDDIMKACEVQALPKMRFLKKLEKALKDS